MLHQRERTPGVMEGDGAYNKHVQLPGDAAALAFPLLERAVRNMELPRSDEPIVLADYGSSQGKNSLAPMCVAIRELRQRVGRKRPIRVYHVDQPSNDFNSLFEVLHRHPGSYIANDSEVYTAAIGKSFYERVLPPETVHLGWSSFAAMWLSRVPTVVPGHIFAVCSSDAVRAEFDRQGREDWEAFLALRARELRPGAQMVVALPGLAEDGSTGIDSLFDQANAVLAEMVAGGLISPEERARMTVGVHPMRKRDRRTPFERSGNFHGLTLEELNQSALPDVPWEQYGRDGDVDGLAMKRALFFRAVFLPSLASALDPSISGNGRTVRKFGNELEQRLKRRLTINPTEMHPSVQTILLAKNKTTRVPKEA